jgi:hypothetical protein
MGTKVLFLHPYNGATYGIPYRMRPGQSPRDLLEAGNTKGWRVLSDNELSQYPKDMIPQWPGEWADVSESEAS